jgi:hypothetical protein
MLCVVPAAAKTYQIGPARDLKSLKAVAPQLKAGDVAEIDPGTYRVVIKLLCNGTKEAPIVIRGVGDTRAVFDAENLDTSGRGPIPRGVFQVEGAYLVLEHLEMKNARNGDNAAGVRFNDSTNAVLRDCKITQCDMGVFGGDKETVSIETCEIAFNGTEKFNGYSHNFYMHGNRVIVRGCYIHDALFGQNYKSRAHYNELWFNWISDSNEGEVGFVDSKGHTDAPHSNALMVGNIVVSKENRTGNSMKFIDFGADMGNAHDGTLFLFHNTLVAGAKKIRFLMLSAPGVRAIVERNAFLGNVEMMLATNSLGKIEAGYNSIVSESAFVDFPKRDFRPKKDNRARQERDALIYEDGEGLKHTLKIDQQYAPHLRAVPRTTTVRDGALDSE